MKGKGQQTCALELFVPVLELFCTSVIISKQEVRILVHDGICHTWEPSARLPYPETHLSPNHSLLIPQDKPTTESRPLFCAEHLHQLLLWFVKLLEILPTLKLRQKSDSHHTAHDPPHSFMTLHTSGPYYLLPGITSYFSLAGSVLRTRTQGRTSPSVQAP